MSIMVTVRAPEEAPGTPQGLRSAVYQRPVPTIKHTGSFGQIYFGLLAERAGFDDALLIDHDGIVSETVIANVLCHDGDAFVWPDAPALAGITMRLLERAGLVAHRRTVRHLDLRSCAAAFVTNSRGISPVGRVDDRKIPQNSEIGGQVTGLCTDIPWDVV